MPFFLPFSHFQEISWTNFLANTGLHCERYERRSAIGNETRSQRGGSPSFNYAVVKETLTQPEISFAAHSPVTYALVLAANLPLWHCGTGVPILLTARSC